MTAEDWAALEADSHVTIAASGSWLEAEGGDDQ